MQTTIPAYAHKELSSETILETACWNIIVTTPPKKITEIHVHYQLVEAWSVGKGPLHIGEHLFL